MECREARDLLNTGVVPSSYDVLQATLGFHLAMCADCRMYRANLAYRQHSDLQLLAALLSQQPPYRSQQLASPSKRSSRRIAGRAVRFTSAALAIGAVFALNTAQLAAATTLAQSPAPASLASQPQDDALAVARQQYSRPAQATLDRRQAAQATENQAAPINAPSQQTGSVHTVAFGDSLWSIAQRYYNDATRWGDIYEANVSVIGANPNLIFPGTRLTLPQTGPGPGRQPEPTTHVVQSGDSLWSIAQRYYGDGTGWSTIHGANQGQIANPNLIYPGMVLTIP